MNPSANAFVPGMVGMATGLQGVVPNALPAGMQTGLPDALGAPLPANTTFDAVAALQQLQQFQQLQAQQAQLLQAAAAVSPEAQIAQMMQSMTPQLPVQTPQEQLEGLLALNLLASANLVQKVQYQQAILTQQQQPQPVMGTPLNRVPDKRARRGLAVRVEGGSAPASSLPSPVSSSSAGTTSPTNMSRKPQKALDVVVCTPWYPEGVSKHDVRLAEELLCFAEFVLLTPSEVAQRSRAIDALRHTDVFSGCRVTPYGSFISGTITSASAVDVCVDMCGKDAITQESIATFVAKAGLTLKGVVSVVDDPAGGQNGFAQVHSEAAAALLNITFYQSRSDVAGDANTAVREWLRRFPSLPQAHSVLRQVLHQTGNLDVCRGGLSSYALLVMLAALCTEISAKVPAVAHCPSALLLQACRVYGGGFAFDTTSICANRGFVTKPQSEEKVFVCDPLNAGNNVAANCTRLFAIKAQLAHCAKALQRWEVDVPVEETHGAKKGYKGRTPLSGIISHQKLWGRATEREEAAAEAAKQSPEAGEEDEEVTLPGDESICDAATTATATTSPPRKRNNSDGSSIAAIFAVTSYDSLASLDDDPALEEGIFKDLDQLTM